MHQCTISLYNAEDLDNAVRLRISDGYIIALTNTAVTEPWPVGVAGTEPVKVYLLPKDHIMRVLDAGVRIVSSEDTALVFPKAE